MFGWISVALWINEFIQPAALFPLFGHVPAPLEMNLKEGASIPLAPEEGLKVEFPFK
jgi:hypothetical protein